MIVLFFSLAAADSSLSKRSVGVGAGLSTRTLINTGLSIGKPTLVQGDAPVQTLTWIPHSARFQVHPRWAIEPRVYTAIYANEPSEQLSLEGSLTGRYYAFSKGPLHLVGMAGFRGRTSNVTWEQDGQSVSSKVRSVGVDVGGGIEWTPFRVLSISAEFETSVLGFSSSDTQEESDRTFSSGLNSFAPTIYAIAWF